MPNLEKTKKNVPNEQRIIKFSFHINIKTQNDAVTKILTGEYI